MVLVVQACITRHMVHEQALDIPIGQLSIDNPMPCEDPPRVGIDDEHRPAPRIEEHAVGGFLPDSRYSQEPLPRLLDVSCEHSLQVAPEIAAKYIEKRFQPFRLDPEIS